MYYEQKSGVKLVTEGKHAGKFRAIVEIYLERKEVDELSLWGAGKRKLRLELYDPEEGKDDATSKT